MSGNAHVRFGGAGRGNGSRERAKPRSGPTLLIRAVDGAAQRVRVRHGRRIRVAGRDGGLARQSNPRFVPEVWRSRWAFMKRASKLTHDDAAALEHVFTIVPEVATAWLLKEQFAVIYDARDRSEAERRLGCSGRPGSATASTASKPRILSPTICAPSTTRSPRSSTAW